MHPSLHEKALACVKQYQKSEKALIDVLTEIDLHKSYLLFGVSSLFRYCVECLGLSESETYRFTQVTRKSYEAPALKQAIGSGILTVSKASRIAPVITKETQECWIKKAATLTQKEIEREVAKQRPQALRKDRFKVLNEDFSELRLTIPVQLEDKLKRAQQVLRTKNTVETLSYLVDFVLKHKDPLEKARRQTEKKPALRKPLNSAGLPAHNSARLPAHIRNAVLVRDSACCTYPGCKEKNFVEVHHRVPLCQGGAHDLNNLVTLCYGHHNLKHHFERSRWKPNTLHPAAAS